MHNITLISTVHKEMGKCDANELYKIIENISPEVIFLEALDETYSEYERYLFSSFEISHKKLEISAIQKYSTKTSAKYIPVLDSGLSDVFERKYRLVCENKDFQKLIDIFDSLTSEYGFKFLNSVESIARQQEMRIVESALLIGMEVDKLANRDVDVYENSMIRNIYSYCENHQFDSAIFLCGVAHRKSIIEKVEKFKTGAQVNPNWIVFEN